MWTVMDTQFRISAQEMPLREGEPETGVHECPPTPTPAEISPCHPLLACHGQVPRTTIRRHWHATGSFGWTMSGGR